MWYAGIDLGKRSSVIVVLDAEGQQILEVRVPNRVAALDRVFKSLPGKGHAACEATSNAFWLADTLETMGIAVQVGHTLKIRLIGEARIKSDKIDARVLAELLRCGFFPAIHVPPREIRQLRELLRGRVRLVRLQTTLRNRIHGLLTRHGIEYRRPQAVGVHAEQYFAALDCAAPVRAIAQTWVSMLREVQQHTKETEEQLKKEMRLGPELSAVVDRLMTIPGVGELSALVFALEIFDVERFASAKNLASYIGFVPSLHQSGDVCRGGSLTKTGNSLVRWILIQDAWTALRNDRYYRCLYQRHAKKHGRQRAVVPVARALLNAIYRVWKEKRNYEEIFGAKAG